MVRLRRKKGFQYEFVSKMGISKANKDVSNVQTSDLWLEDIAIRSQAMAHSSPMSNAL